MSEGFSPDLEFLLDSNLGSTEYRIRQVIQCLSENYDGFPKEDGDIREISIRKVGEGKGFCGHIYGLKIVFDSGNEFNLVSKISSDANLKDLTSAANVDREERTRLVERLHNRECDSYKLLNKLNNIPIPKIYYMEKVDKEHGHGGIILMEDLSKRGSSLDKSLYRTKLLEATGLKREADIRFFQVFESVTVGQCFDMARILADLQTQLNFMEDQEWRKNESFSLKCPDGIVKILQELITAAFNDVEDGELKRWIQDYLDIELGSLIKFSVEDFTAQYGSINTLLHNDLWTNNFIVKIKEDGSFSDEIDSIIDWQLACVGNPLLDLCSFVILCASADVRRRSEKDIVDFYYDELCRNYKKYEAEPGFTRDQAHEFYNISFVKLIIELIMTFSCNALRFSRRTSSDSEENRHKYESLLKRMKAGCEDAQPILQKYGLIEKFTPRK